jgi:hypothetical protein
LDVFSFLHCVPSEDLKTIYCFKDVLTLQKFFWACSIVTVGILPFIIRFTVLLFRRHCRHVSSAKYGHIALKKKIYLTKYCQCKRQMWGNNISIFRFKGMNYEFLQDSTLKGEVKKWNWCKQDTKNSDLLWQMAFNNLPILKRLRYTKIWYLTLYKKLF